MADPRYTTVDSDFRDKQTERTGFGVMNAAVEKGNVRRAIRRTPSRVPTDQPSSSRTPVNNAVSAGTPNLSIASQMQRTKAVSTTFQIVLWASVPATLVAVICVVCLLFFGMTNMATGTFVEKMYNGISTTVMTVFGWEMPDIWSYFFILYTIQIVTALGIIVGAALHYSVRGIKCLGGENMIFKKIVFLLMIAFSCIPGAPIIVLPLFGTVWMITVIAYPN